MERDERKRRTPKIAGHEPNHGPPRNLGSIIRATHFGKQWSPWNAARAGAFGAEVHERPVGRKVHELWHNPDDDAGIEEEGVVACCVAKLEAPVPRPIERGGKKETALLRKT